MKLNQIMNTASLVNNFKKNYFYAFDLYLTNLPKKKEIDAKLQSYTCMQVLSPIKSLYDRFRIYYNSYTI